MSDEQKQPAPQVEEKTAAASAVAEPKQDQALVIPDKFKTLVEAIEKMSVLDLSEFVKILEDKFGVSAAAPLAMAVAPGGAGAADSSEVKSEFDIELSSAGDNKIAVIKVVREITAKGLKEAKDMVEGAPVIIKTAAKKDEADDIKNKLEQAGASVTLK